MKKYSFLLLGSLICFSFASYADEISIVDVKRNITLSDEELVYKDFYLNAGQSAGLKKNLVVNVKRIIQVKDISSKQMGDFESLVGQIKIIQVSDKVAVGREFKLFPRDEEAMLEQTGIMTGDRIDLTSAFIDTSKPKRTTASNLEAEAVTNAGMAAAAVSAALPAAPVAPLVPVAPLAPPVSQATPTPSDSSIQASASTSASSREPASKSTGAIKTTDAAVAALDSKSAATNTKK